MGRPRTRPLDLRVMCRIWDDEEFRSLTCTSQVACIRGVSMMGRDCCYTSRRYHAADFDMDRRTFELVAQELSQIGAWRIIDHDTVEVQQYKDLIILVPPLRPRIPMWLRNLILERDGHRCVRCGSSDQLELDHIVPWALGGREEPANLQALCRPCNQAKGMKV